MVVICTSCFVLLEVSLTFCLSTSIILHTHSCLTFLQFCGCWMHMHSGISQPFPFLSCGTGMYRPQGKLSYFDVHVNTNIIAVFSLMMQTLKYKLNFENKFNTPCHANDSQIYSHHWYLCSIYYLMTSAIAIATILLHYWEGRVDH